MTGQEMEIKIKDMLGSKITAGEMDFLHGFYRISGIYQYSIRNTIMIMIQGGSIALGFDRWQKIGRHVKRGEHANIEILVPKMINTTDKETGDKDQLCTGFFGRKVFDITQTDGKALEYENNSQETINYEYGSIAPVLGHELKIAITTAITGSARGYFKHGITGIDAGPEIVISSMSNNSDKIKTLMHELGHYLLGHDQGGQVPAQEVEAELVSFLTCSALGVEFKESPLYIISYNEHKPEVRALKVISAVQKILKAIL